jgi:diguanylate cyclase (GGDEF)-like protein
MPETDLKSAGLVTERLRKSIEELEVVYEGQRLSMTMSFGIVFQDAGENLTGKELIDRADHALYRAKNSGRNRCCFFDTAEESLDSMNRPHPTAALSSKDFRRSASIRH